jgi:hypothetical protein
MSYEEWMEKAQPPWLQNEAGRRWARALGRVLDGAVDGARDAVLARYPSYAPEDALALLGHERGLERFPGEYPEAYRSRLLNAWEFWRWGGTLRGLQYWLNAAGYDVYVYEHYRQDRTIWAEFSLYLWPHRPEFTTDRWDDGVGAWDDDTSWSW